MKADKDLYRRLRALSPDQLWRDEVPRFDRADSRERLARVAVVRAVGVAFAGSGDPETKAAVQAWLARLLQDPQEKIRRYAMAAIPKVGGVAGAESQLLDLLRRPSGEREKASVGRTLARIGGEDTLAAVDGLAPPVEQKVRARVTRLDQPGAVKLDQRVPRWPRMRLHLRCRRGLEEILRGEVEAFIAARGGFRLLDVRSACVDVAPLADFTLADLYTLRCFASAGFSLGLLRPPRTALADIAALVAAPEVRRALAALTDGPPRYRLEFVGPGHQRAAVQDLAARIYAAAPEILNDPRRALWSVDIHAMGPNLAVELRPRLSPDPRWFYRRDDVAAASHPPLAAAMVRLAGPRDGEVAWDPFCGSGLELIERALRGGVGALYGTDLDPAAIAVAKDNVAAANLSGVAARFACCDFRDAAAVASLGLRQATLVITNPPMGRRLRVPDLRGLIGDLFAAASRLLAPGGRLVFPNPLRLDPPPALGLRRDVQQPVDLGGYTCQLEMYRKS